MRCEELAGRSEFAFDWCEGIAGFEDGGWRGMRFEENWLSAIEASVGLTFAIEESGNQDSRSPRYSMKDSL